jgi:hypothetical protein
MGLLHTTAKTGATGSGNSVPPVLETQCHRVCLTEEILGLRHTETGATEIWKPVTLDLCRQSRCKTEKQAFNRHFSPPLSLNTNKGLGGLGQLLMVLHHHHLEAVAQTDSEAQRRWWWKRRKMRSHSIIWVHRAKETAIVISTNSP